MTNKQDDETMKDKVIRLLRKGYRRSQLINDFGFAERTVDAAISTYKELDNGNVEDTKKGSKSPADNEAPAHPSKGEGKGAAGTVGRDSALAIRKDKESVLPEWLERDVAEIFDGQTRDQKIFLAGMSVPLMGLRLFAEGVKPIIDLLATWQEGQAQAARAAQGSGIEMAQAAGEAAAAGVGKFFMDTKPWLSAAPDPWKAMIVDTMRPIFQQMMGQVMGSFMRFAPQGQFGMQPPSPTAQSGFQAPQSAQTGFQQTRNLREATQEEIQEVFGD
jgi:hypothetical protein